MNRLYYVLLFLLVGCGLLKDVKIFKQTEAVSQNTYAIRDTVMYGRYDLLEQYIKELTKLIVVPSDFIEVGPLIDKDGKLVVILPERYTNQKIIAVGSKEYEKLISIQSIANQILRENKHLLENTAVVDNIVREQSETLDSLYYDNQKYKAQNKLQEENISKKNITIFFLIGLICMYLYLKFNFKLPFI